MKNLAKKMIDVMNECSRVLKNGENSFHHYKYVTSADVLKKVNVSLVKNGICTIAVPELLNIVEVTNLKGNIEHLATVKMDILLIDKDSGETVTITGMGSGQDGGDKAIMKAQTAAIKYAYLLSLAISTGDDPEADQKTDENSLVKSTNNQRKIVTSVISEKTTSKEKDAIFCEICNSNITKKVLNFSKERYGKALCMVCQKKVKAIA